MALPLKIAVMSASSNRPLPPVQPPVGRKADVDIIAPVIGCRTWEFPLTTVFVPVCSGCSASRTRSTGAARQTNASRITASSEFRPHREADHARYLIRCEMDRNTGQLE